MPPLPTYNQRELDLAIAAYQDGLSLRECQQLFNVPRDTIQRKSKKHVPTMKHPGPKAVLSADEEECLVEWLLECAKRAFPRTSKHLIFFYKI